MTDRTKTSKSLVQRDSDCSCTRTPCCAGAARIAQPLRPGPLTLDGGATVPGSLADRTCAIATADSTAIGGPAGAPRHRPEQRLAIMSTAWRNLYFDKACAIQVFMNGWHIDHRCTNCDVARQLAPGLIGVADGRSVIIRQPRTDAEQQAVSAAAHACPHQVDQVWRAAAGSGVGPVPDAAGRARLPVRPQLDTHRGRQFVSVAAARPATA